MKGISSVLITPRLQVPVGSWVELFCMLLLWGKAQISKCVTERVVGVGVGDLCLMFDVHRKYWESRPVTVKL